jgi:transposase
LGHAIRLLPPAHVKPYVKRGKKNDAADAAAICEAVGRPHMQFVPIKSAESQGALLLHRSRELLVRQRTMLICALRSHLAESGVVAGQGKGNFAKLVARLETVADEALPELARAALRLIAAQIDDANAKIKLGEGKRAAVGWSSKEVIQWINARMEARKRAEGQLELPLSTSV